MSLTIHRAVVALATLALLSGSVGLTGAWYTDVETGIVTIGTGDFIPPIPHECLAELGFSSQESQQFKQAVANGALVIRIGTDGADNPSTVLPGGETFGGQDSKNDIIFGMGGNDVLEGGSQDDCLFGGDGDDTHRGGNGVDIAYGGNGNDTIFGGSGGVSNNSGDVLRGDHGPLTGTGPSPTTCDTTCNDSIYGGGAAGTPAGTPTNEGSGGDARNDIFGGPGNDYLEGHGNNDVMNGEGGNDEMYGLGGGDTMNGGDGDDELIGGSGTDTLNGGDGLDMIWNGDRTLVPDQLGMATTLIVAQENVTPIDETGAEEAPAEPVVSEQPAEEAAPVESVEPQPVEQPGEEPTQTDAEASGGSEATAPPPDDDSPAPADDAETTDDTGAPAAGDGATPSKGSSEGDARPAKERTETLPGGDEDRDVVRGGSGSDVCIAEDADAVNGCEDVVPAGETVVEVAASDASEPPADNSDGDSGDHRGTSYAGGAMVAAMSTNTVVRRGRARTARPSKAPAAGTAGDDSEGAAA